jgi:thiamine-phosphate pyrophosphorylase
VRPAVDFTLYLVTDRGLAGGRSPVEIVGTAVEGGATVVQLREKDIDTRAFLDLAREIKHLLDPLGVPLIINDRLDVALACDAAGVHVGQSDLPCAVVRRIAGTGFVIGVSVNDPDEARRAEADGADYLGVSPVFDTPTKTDAPAATGLAGLAAIRAATRLPLVGIGGISTANAEAVVRAGADGIAVVSAIVAATDPRAAALALREAIERGRR